MLMHKTNASNEVGVRPSPELIAAVGEAIGEMSRAGIFRDGAGLRASSLGVRIERKGGRTKATPGPFVGKNELPAALGVLRVRSREEAVEWASRFAALMGDAEVDIRPVTEPWDLGLGEKPPGDPTVRYMAVYKADARSEAGALPSPELRTAIARLIEEMKRAGVFVMAEALKPGAESKRIRSVGGRPVVMDGPFTESKELIAGYVTLELPSMAEALIWGQRYAAVLEGAELDVRPLFEPVELRAPG
jgi:hypothetical protein